MVKTQELHCVARKTLTKFLGEMNSDYDSNQIALKNQRLYKVENLGMGQEEMGK